uniref:Protein kinase domain-containing protein n=1 Tax=Aegilops tauschii TaxID=37682 RepID=M8BQM4_AEGTA
MRTVMEVCLGCLAKEPTQRPSVEDVLWNLQFAAQAHKNALPSIIMDSWLKARIQVYSSSSWTP